MEREHHHVGFSRLGLASLCPQSCALKPKLSSGSNTKYDRAHRMHLLSSLGSEKLLLQKLDAGEISDFEASTVQRYWDTLEEKVRDVAQGEKITKRITEEKLSILNNGEGVLTHGYPDNVVLIGDPIIGAVIGDLKTHPNGDFEEYFAKWQLAGIAVALDRTYKSLRFAVGFAIASATSNVSIYELEISNVDELRKWYRDIKEVVDAVNSENPEYSPGPHCEYCPRAGTCQETYNYMATAISRIDGKKCVEFRGENVLIHDEKELAQQIKILKSIIKTAEAALKVRANATLTAIDQGFDFEYLQSRSTGRIKSIVDYEKARDLLDEKEKTEIERLTLNKWTWKDFSKVLRRLSPDLKTSEAERLAKERLEPVIQEKVKSPSVQIKKGVEL